MQNTPEVTDGGTYVGFRPPLRFPKPPRSQKSKERRQNRSPHAGDALSAALSCAAQRASLDAVVVADDFGMLVCNSSNATDPEHLAAVVPIVARGRARAGQLGGVAQDLSVRTVRVLGEKLHVAAIGGAKHARDAGLWTSASATLRILA